MGQLMKIACMVAALVVPIVAAAEPVKMYKEASATAISGLALTSTRYTGWISVPTSRSIAFLVDYTYGAATSVSMSCEVEDDATTANGGGNDIQSLTTPVNGVMTSTVASWKQPISAADEDWVWLVTNLPADYVNCWFTASGANGSDVVTVKHRRITP